MSTTLLSYLPILIAPPLASGLVLALRRWVALPASPTSAAPAASGGNLDLPSDVPPHRLVWADITREVNPLIAYVLPILTSIIIVVLILWPFAYLGWAIIELDPDPGWSAQVPPWFGNLGYFLGFGFVGLFIALLGIFLASAAGLVLHALGKCILWPTLCACLADADQDSSGDDPSVTHDGPEGTP